MTRDAARDPEVDEDSIDAEGDSTPKSTDSSHLDDIEDGAGCAEIWERLSERREE